MKSVTDPTNIGLVTQWQICCSCFTVFQNVRKLGRRSRLYDRQNEIKPTDIFHYCIFHLQSYNTAYFKHGHCLTTRVLS